MARARLWLETGASFGRKLTHSRHLLCPGTVNSDLHHYKAEIPVVYS